MAFVTCKQFKDSQQEQDDKAVSAEDSLLDKSGGEGAGKVTVEKIKEAIAGDIAVSVKPNAGINGNGTEESPLALAPDETLKFNEEGKLGVDTEKVGGVIGNALAGNGLNFDERSKQLNVSTARIVNAAGTVIGYAVNQGE
ncbi:hypothetical protein [Avibacterium avium]|uniref:hypothetical protein n=1 Tax=Avibacterium avium TaxID=751 RepID=UPI003BF7C018